MWHEQMRSDRDDWIRINWENVYSPFTSQYQQVDTLNLAQYDYGSVMHYSPQVSLTVRQGFAVCASVVLR